jgi:hypothetical protein
MKTAARTKLAGDLVGVDMSLRSIVLIDELDASHCWSWIRKCVVLGRQPAPKKNLIGHHGVS